MRRFQLKYSNNENARHCSTNISRDCDGTPVGSSSQRWQAHSAHPEHRTVIRPMWAEWTESNFPRTFGMIFPLFLFKFFYFHFLFWNNCRVTGLVGNVCMYRRCPASFTSPPPQLCSLRTRKLALIQSRVDADFTGRPAPFACGPFYISTSPKFLILFFKASCCGNTVYFDIDISVSACKLCNASVLGGGPRL